MQTIPNGDCWKWDILNPRSPNSSQNGLSLIINKEGLNNVSRIAKREADYSKPKQFLYNTFAFHKVSQSMNGCYFKIFCYYRSNSDPKVIPWLNIAICKMIYLSPYSSQKLNQCLEKFRLLNERKI